MLHRTLPHFIHLLLTYSVLFPHSSDIFSFKFHLFYFVSINFHLVATNEQDPPPRENYLVRTNYYLEHTRR